MKLRKAQNIIISIRVETGQTPAIPDGEAGTGKSLEQVNGGQGVESRGLNKNGPQRPTDLNTPVVF